MTMTVQQNHGWISVNSQLPDAESHVLGCCRLIGAVTVLVVSREECDEGHYWVAIAADGYPDYGNAVDVTHWQPLPKLPR